MNNKKITSIRVAERTLQQLQIIKAIERRATYDDIITDLLNKHYSDSKFNNEFFEQQT